MKDRLSKIRSGLIESSLDPYIDINPYSNNSTLILDATIILFVSNNACRPTLEGEGIVQLQ